VTICRLGLHLSQVGGPLSWCTLEYVATVRRHAAVYLLRCLFNWLFCDGELLQVGLLLEEMTGLLKSPERPFLRLNALCRLGEERGLLVFTHLRGLSELVLCLSRIVQVADIADQVFFTLLFCLLLFQGRAQLRHDVSAVKVLRSLGHSLITEWAC